MDDLQNLHHTPTAFFHQVLRHHLACYRQGGFSFAGLPPALGQPA